MAIPLEVAGLCEDCQHISANRKECEKCKSKAMLPLAEVLNRDESHRAPVERIIAKLDEVLR